MRVAVSWVRDEVDVIAWTVGLMAEQVDALIVMDHGSTDGTRDVLAGLSGEYPLIVLDDASGKFRQAPAMNQLVTIAAENLRADWVIPFDADEVWELPDVPDAEVIRLRVFDHVPVDGVDGLPWRRTDPSSTKVVFKPQLGRNLRMGNHAVTSGRETRVSSIVHHFPNRSREQFEKKVRRGVATYQSGDYGGHWAQMLAEIEEHGVEHVFRHFTAGTTDGLVYDPVQPQSTV